MLQIKIDAAQLVMEGKKIGSLADKFPKEITASINKALVAGKKHATELIKTTYNVKSAPIKVNKGGMVGSIESDGPMKSVKVMSPEPVGKGVSVEIIRGSRKVVGVSGKGMGAFRLPDGRIMERRQAARFPIYPVSTIGIPQMLGSHKVADPTQKEMEEVVLHELETRLLGKL